jgi:hypothetical protein
VRVLISACLLSAVKILAMVFYRFDAGWIGRVLPAREWARIRLVIVLNHTSLFEPVYGGALPWRFIWNLARGATFPAADITFNRPLIGKFFRFLAPSVVSITRTRDGTWTEFLKTCSPDSVVMIAPEGRMKRPDGLDKHGQPMTVRGGVADILAGMDWDGLILFAYSGGLHHIHTPGQGLPRLFQRARINFEALDLQEYRRLVGVPPADQQNPSAEPYRSYRKRVISDLESRRDRFCPNASGDLINQ